MNVPPTNAIDLGTGRTAVALSAGYDHTCAILDNGVLKCWGADNFGVMGNGGNWGGGTAEHTPAAIDLGTGRTAVAVSAGYAHTCVILDNGDLKCWGQGDTGQNGNGNMGQWGHLTSPPSTAIDLGTGRTAAVAYLLEKTTPAPFLTTEI